MAAGIFSALSYGALTGVANGPTELTAGAPEVAEGRVIGASLGATASLLSGSLDHLFESGGFAGPNRADKTDRYRPPVDLVAFTSEFSGAREQLVAMRSAADPIALGQSLPGPEAGEEAGPRISVAAIDPRIGGAALAAIDGIAPANADTPTPNTASDQLAYARATAPLSTGSDYVTTQAVRVAAKQLECLSTAIYFEARGESYRGQVAVAQVVLNRTKDHRYPDTICAVVYQNQHRRNACQFSFACDGIPDRINDRKAWAQAEEISKKVTGGELYLAEVGEATHYHATYVRPAWAPRMDRLTQIGLHVFYKFKPGWRFG